MEAQVTAPPWPKPNLVADDAPWAWLSAGWQDFKQDPVLSLGYGLVFVAAGYAMSIGLWRLGLSAFIPVAVGAFALVGPMMAMGLYELSRRREAGEPLEITKIVFVNAASPMQIAYVGFLIMFGLFVWARIAMLLYALFVSGTYLPLADFTTFALGTPQGLAMLGIGTVIGGMIAFVLFALTAFSIPMLMDRDTDFFTAIASSLDALKTNTKAVFLWAWIIGFSIVIGAATGLLAFLVLFPLLGHATWHAYRNMFAD